MKNILNFIVLSMAVFSEAYYSEGNILHITNSRFLIVINFKGSLFSKATNSIVTTAKYLTDSEERAKRIVNISQNADVDFCKSFWFLSEFELMHHLPSVVAQSVAVSKVIQLPPEPLTLKVGEEEIEVPIPNSHIGNFVVFY